MTKSTARHTTPQLSQQYHDLWVHVGGQFESASLAQHLGLDGNIIRDVIDLRELPRVEFKEPVEYIFMRLPVVRAVAVKTAPLLAAVSVICEREMSRLAWSTKNSPL